MKNVIVFGLGSFFEENITKVRDCYEIVAVTDNDTKYIKTTEIGEYRFVPPNEICASQFDFVIVLTEKYKYRVYLQLLNYGIDSQKILLPYRDGFEAIPNEASKSILSDMNEYAKQNRLDRFNINIDELQLEYKDKFSSAGFPPEHYFAQDIWCAQKVAKNNPKIHYDIGSRLDGFIAHLLAQNRSVRYIDIRPLPYEIIGLEYIFGDAMHLNVIASNSINSLSCLHAMEHFGLGRYNDPIAPQGYIEAAHHMSRVLDSGGYLYIGVPIGPQDKLVFNAHRIFTINTIVELFEDMIIDEIAIVYPKTYVP